MSTLVAPLSRVIFTVLYVIACSIVVSASTSPAVHVTTSLMAFYLIGAMVMCILRGSSEITQHTVRYCYSLSTSITPMNEGYYILVQSGVAVLSLWFSVLIVYSANPVNSKDSSIGFFDLSGSSCMSSLYATFLLVLSVGLFLSSYVRVLRIVVQYVRRCHEGKGASQAFPRTTFQEVEHEMMLREI